MTHSTIDTADLGDAVNRYGPTAARPRPDGQKRLNSKTVDMHAHVAIPEAAQYMAPHVDASRIAMVKHTNEETSDINAQQDKDRGPVAIKDLDDRMAVLDAQGIDMQLVAPPPPQCYYQSEIEHAVIGTRMLNDGNGEWAAAGRTGSWRWVRLPFQKPNEAVRSHRFAWAIWG